MNARLLPTLLILPALLSLMFLMPGCSRGPKSLIVGKWQGSGGTLEFSSDGKVKMNTGPASIDATYKFLDDAHLQITNTSLGSTNTEEMKVSFPDNDTMTSVSGGATETLHRVK